MERLDGHMQQLNGQVGQLGRSVDKLDETNRRLAELRDQAAGMEKRLATIEGVARKFGGIGTSIEPTSPPDAPALPLDPALSPPPRIDRIPAFPPQEEPLTLMPPKNSSTPTEDRDDAHLLPLTREQADHASHAANSDGLRSIVVGIHRPGETAESPGIQVTTLARPPRR
jgi:hypothetical protein